MGIQILIADDHGVLRAGLRALLSAETDFSVVGEAGSGHETIRLVAELKPDVVLLDLSMPGQSGIEIARQVRELHPDVRVLVLTVHEDEGLLREALRAGASGYIVKRAVESELIDAIRAVARGELYVHPSLTRALLRRRPEPAAKEWISPQSLTPRETEVLRRLVGGYTNRQVAEELGLSVRTVETHRANLMDKLGLRSRVELVRWAANQGLLDWRASDGSGGPDNR